MKRAKDFYLNELSLQKVDNKEQAQEVIEVFIKTIAALRRYGLGSLRHSEAIDLKTIEIAENYFIYNWLSDSSVNKELHSRFRAIATKAPMFEVSDKLLFVKSQVSDVYFEDKQAMDFWAAYNDDSFLVSFLSDKKWNVSLLNAVINTIKDSNLDEKNIEIMNISSLLQCIEHITWIKNNIEPPDIRFNEPLHFSVVSNDYFEKQRDVSSLNVEEKITYYKEVFKVIATLNFYEYNAYITKKSNRLVFEFGEGSSKIYLALDTQHGSIECHNHQGAHKGEYNFKGIFQKNSTHVLDVK